MFNSKVLVYQRLVGMLMGWCQAADVSNPTRPIRTARAWNCQVYEDGDGRWLEMAGCWFIGSCCITFRLEDSEDSEDLDDLWWLLMTYDDLWLGTWNGNGIPQKDVAYLRLVSWYSLITRHVRSSMQRETRWQHGENFWEWDGWVGSLWSLK